MKIIESYIAKQLIIPFIGSFTILTSVLVVGNLTKLADFIVNKGVPLSFVIQLFLLQMPALMCYTIPLAVLLSVLIVFGKLSQDREITAMHTSGISLWNIIALVVLLGICVSIASVIFNDKVLAKARYTSRTLVREMGFKNPTAFLEEGAFVNIFSKYIMYISKINKNKLEQIRIYQPQPNAPTRTVIAEKGEFSYNQKQGKLHLVLYNGTSEESDKNNPGSFYKLNFKKYTMTLDIDTKSSKTNASKKPKDMDFSELSQKIKELKDKKIEVLELETEFFKKISLSFASLTFVLCALPIAVLTKRREKSFAFAIGLAIATLYYVLLVSGENASLRGFVNPIWAMLAPNIILGLMGMGLILKMQRH